MSLFDVMDLYDLISKTTSEDQDNTRKLTQNLRKNTLNNILNKEITKVAFDTRRIDHSDFNPRRGLQNYQRSEAFLSEGSAQRVKNFTKLRNVLNQLKQSYGKENEWQDSNARALLMAVDRGLRSNINDGDFGLQNQPGVGSFDYLEELLAMRYRLSYDEMIKISEIDLSKVILSKDEELLHKDIKIALEPNKYVNNAVSSKEPEITKHDISVKSYDSLIDKIFDGCKASSENPVVERIVTISIKDILPGQKKEG